MKETSFFLKLRDGRRLALRVPALMEVWNVTPDSFYDGGAYYKDGTHRYKALESHLRRPAWSHVAIVDVGGESTRPGAAAVDEAEELRRVLPIIRLLKERCSHVLVSVDTMKPSVAEEAIEAGADMINDVSAGEASDNRMLKVAIEKDVPLILMHMQGTPQTMQVDPHYEDVVDTIVSYLREKMHLARHMGLDKERLLLDPGIGFGKRMEHNLSIIQSMERFKSLGYPVVIGASMKQIIGDLTGAPIEKRLAGSIGFHLAAMLNGCDVLRVHNAHAMHDAITTFMAGVKTRAYV